MPSRRSTTHLTLTRAIVGVAAFVALVAGIASVPGAVGAAERNDSITSVTIEHGDPVVLYNLFTVHVAWSAPDDVAAGDTFSAQWSPEPAFAFFAASVELRDPDDPTLSFGTCQVTASSIDCTYNSNVETHDHVSGTVFFTGQFTRVRGADDIRFTVPNGATYVLPTPPVGVRPAATVPTTVTKYGWVDTSGDRLMWQVTVPSSFLVTTGAPVVLTDVYDPTLQMLGATLQVQWMSAADYPTSYDDWTRWQTLSPGTGSGTYGFTDRAADHAFDLVINDPVDDGRVYRIRYLTGLPDDARQGDTFDNVVTGLTTAPVRAVAVNATAGGEGTGQTTTTTSTPTSTTTSTSSTTPTTVPTSTTTAPTNTIAPTAAPSTSTTGAPAPTTSDVAPTDPPSSVARSSVDGSSTARGAGTGMASGSNRVAGTSAGRLALTGDDLGLAAIAALCLLAGTALVAAGRRRTSR